MTNELSECVGRGLDKHMSHFMIIALWDGEEPSANEKRNRHAHEIEKAIISGELMATVELREPGFDDGYREITDINRIRKIEDGRLNGVDVRYTIERDQFKAWLRLNNYWPLPNDCLLLNWFDDENGSVRDDVKKAIDEHRRRSAAPYDGILGNLSDLIRDKDKMEYMEIRGRLLEEEKLSESFIKELIDECEANPDSFSCRPDNLQSDIKFLAMLLRAHKGTIKAEALGNAGAGSQVASEPGSVKDDTWMNDPALTKLEKQLKAILEVIMQKGFDPMKIPDGEKGAIEALCRADYPLFFDTDSSFSTAWKKGRSLFKMANHASFARRGNG